jgi:hypothetical protein
MTDEKIKLILSHGQPSANNNYLACSYPSTFSSLFHHSQKSANNVSDDRPRLVRLANKSYMEMGEDFASFPGKVCFHSTAHGEKS